jgi:hypothetical protein
MRPATPAGNFGAALSVPFRTVTVGVQTLSGAATAGTKAPVFGL